MATDKELKALVAGKLEGVSLTTVTDVINAYNETIVEEVIDGSGKAVVGKFGTFSRTDVDAKPARIGVENPMKKGTTYDVPAKPARTKLTFKLSKSGKDLGL
jgi:nucleoid DNA-binding protein